MDSTFEQLGINDRIGDTSKGTEAQIPFLDGDALYEANLIRPNDAMCQPCVALAVVQDGERIVIATTKAAMLIQGSAKGGKGKTVVIKTVACLIGEFGPLQSDLVKRKVIILHSDDHPSNLAALGLEISRMAGVQNDFHKNLIIVCIAQLIIPEKYAVLESVIRKHPDIGVLALDLAWDWVNSVNDEVESKYMLDKFLGLAIKHDFLLIIVTHESRAVSGGRGSAKGHQGSHWVAKAQTVVNVRKKRDGFVITALHTRGRDFGSIFFKYDGHSYTFPSAITQTDSTQINRKAAFDTVDDDTHLKLLNPIMSEKNRWDAGALRERIRSDYSNTVEPIGINLSKGLLKYYRDRGWILKEGKLYVLHTKNARPEHVLKTRAYRTTVPKDVRTQETEDDNCAENKSADQKIDEKT